MAYRLTSDGTILRLADNAFIPPSATNRDYQAYEAWLKAGNTPEPAAAPAAPAELTAAEKLAAAGLSVEELRELLGLS